MKDLTAFIFARGGSKGVKNKNIRIVGDKPLIAHAIEQGIASAYIKNVVVSTDSKKIADVAYQYGAEVLMRPVALAEDKTPELEAWKHAISHHPNLELFISLPATSPMRSSIDIDNAIERFKSMHNACDILFGITKSHRSPYLNMVKKTKDDLLNLVIPSDAVRRQDVPLVYDVTTCIYVANPVYIKTCHSLSDGDIGCVEIPKSRALDIDDEFDLYLADLMLKNPFNMNS